MNNKPLLLNVFQTKVYLIRIIISLIIFIIMMIIINEIVFEINWYLKTKNVSKRFSVKIMMNSINLLLIWLFVIILLIFVYLLNYLVFFSLFHIPINKFMLYLSNLKWECCISETGQIHDSNKYFDQLFNNLVFHLSIWHICPLATR